MLLRLMSAVMFVLAGAAAGTAGSQRLRRNRELCREIGCVLRNTSVYIRCMGLDVYHLVRRLRGNCSLSFIDRLPDSFQEGQNFHRCWHEALSCEELPDEERGLLEELGRTIGTSDVSGQLSAISAREEELRQLEKKRAEAYLQKGRMYRSIGVLFGVMAGILVI